MELFKNKAVILDDILAIDFDFVLTEGMPAAALLARALDLPYMI